MLKTFLQELPTSGVPDYNAPDVKDFNCRVKYRQRIRDYLINRFRSEYLGQLHQHAFKKENSKQLEIGDIIILEDER